MRNSIQRASRNVLLLYAIRICTVSAALIVPNLVLYVQQYGVTQDQFFWLEIAFAATLLVVQIPSGRFADRFGRKRSMQLGSLILPVSQLCYLLGESFNAFLVAEVLGAIGFAFLSGADEAIFYESLVFIKRRHLHSKLWGRAFLCGFLAMSSGNFLGGLIAPVSPIAPFILATIGFCFLGFLTLFLEEPVFKHKPVLSQKVNALKVIRVCLIENSNLRWLMIYPATFIISMQSLLWVYQSYFLLNGVSQYWHGTLIALFNLVAGVSSLFAFQIEKKLGQKLIILIPLLIVSSSLLLLSGMQTLLFIPIICIQQCVRGFLPSIFSGYINTAIAPAYRATALSIKSSCELLYYIMMLQLTRITVAHGGVREAFFVHGVITLVVGAGLAIVRLRRHKTS